MKKRKYTLTVLARRLLQIAAPQKYMILAATISSIIGNTARMTLMGTGSCLILYSAGMMKTGSFRLWTFWFVFSAVMIAVMRYAEGVSAHVEAYNLLADMRTGLFHKLRELAPACLVDRERGDVLSVAIADIDTIEKFFAHTIGPMFTVILLPVMTIVYAASIHASLALALIPVYLMISVVIPLIGLLAGRGLGVTYRTRIGQMKSLILETVYGLKDLQIFRQCPRRLERIREKSSEINRTAHGMTFHRQIVNALPQFFVYTSRILIVLIASRLIGAEEADMNAIVILSFIVSASFSSTQSLISVVSGLLETFAAAERLFEILDDKPAVTPPAEAVPVTEIRELRLEDVTFRYGEQQKDVLSGVSLTIRKGETIGIIGESGAGKSTILRLLLRFWDPVSGRITLDGTDMRYVSFENLRARIGLVEQQTFIYDDTAAGNIGFGKPDATEEEIRTAAHRAGIGRRIERLPDGYDTRLGEFGNQLSGGERQRIGIARVMLTNPDIIIMDEPTSSLDIFNEKLILKTLQEEYTDKTIILVSHRHSTLTGCSRILGLKDGKLRELTYIR